MAFKRLVAVTYLNTMLVLVGGGVLDLDLLLQVIHSIAQLQIVCPTHIKKII